MKLRIRKERIFLAFALLRIVLAFVLSALILNERSNIATIFFIATALIAFFEVMLSKRMAERSLLKSIFDFFADRLLINLVAISLAVKSLLPLWVMLVFLLRDLLTLAIGSIMFYRDFRREFKPTALGKICLFFQIITYFVLELCLAFH